MEANEEKTNEKLWFFLSSFYALKMLSDINFFYFILFNEADKHLNYRIRDEKVFQENERKKKYRFVYA